MPATATRAREKTTKSRLQPRWDKGSHSLRLNAYRPYVEAREVLDLGCAVGYQREDWVHAFVAQHAARAVGVDLNAEYVAEIRERGYDVRVGDVETLRLCEKFDVVLAGELIEHLNNAGLLMDTARAHLRPSGRFVLSTPNPFAISNSVYRLGRNVRVNEDHTAWFCEHTIRTLLQRHGMVADRIAYIPHETPGALRSVIARVVRAPLPERLRWGTMLVVAKLAAK